MPVHYAADIERAISAFAHDLNGGLWCCRAPSLRFIDS